MKDFRLNEKGNTGFSVPEDYFEGFTGRLDKRLKDDPKVVSIFRPKVWHYAAAAIVILMVSITINHRSKELIMPEESAIEDYFADRQVAEDLLVEVLDVNDLSELKNKYVPDDLLVEEQLASNPDFEQYIIE